MALTYIFYYKTFKRACLIDRLHCLVFIHTLSSLMFITIQSDINYMAMCLVQYPLERQLFERQWGMNCGTSFKIRTKIKFA